MCLKNLVKKRKKNKEQIITNTAKYTDEELINLFSDEKPIKSKQKKHKRNTPILHKHVITEELEIEIEHVDSPTTDTPIEKLEIEPVDSQTSDTLIEESEIDPVDSQTSNTTYFFI